MEEKEPLSKFHDDIRKLSEAIKETYLLAEQEYAPMVDHYISTECKDSRKIETLLDDLLSCACDERILALFKKLCRYYYFINPEVASSFVYDYRKIWDEEYDENSELNLLEDNC